MDLRGSGVGPVEAEWVAFMVKHDSHVVPWLEWRRRAPSRCADSAASARKCKQRSWTVVMIDC